MNADTDRLQALTEQTAALSRKVSALTGRVTVMGSHLNRLDDLVEDQVPLLIRTIARLAGVEPAGHAAPGPKRHLRVIQGGRQ